MAVKATASRHLSWTFAPFLYPALRAVPLVPRRYISSSHITSPGEQSQYQVSLDSPASTVPTLQSSEDVLSNYSSTPFADTCTLTLSAGAGGHGCISFLRDIHISAGPPNGGDGGTGGSIYIQATSSQTSLHKLARRRHISGGRGRNGQGKGRGGERGADTVIEVPVGTVVREISRYDPITEAEAEARRVRMLANTAAASEEDHENSGSTDLGISSSRKKWLLYPGALPSTIATEMPTAPKPRRTGLHAAEPPVPIHLDLTRPMSRPILLIAGAAGGLGNPHFMTRALPRPKYATRGEEGTKVDVVLELKLLADVGLVGKPNAGKSTLLRSITKSRARVGDWAFTTLKPNVGTVVIDDGRGWITPISPPSPFPASSSSPSSPSEDSSLPAPKRREDKRTHLSIADIPGLIHDAHLDKGLGISFLRHVERARVLAFVVDLSAGDAISAVKSLWREVSMYEALSGMATREAEEVEWTPFSDSSDGRAVGTGGGEGREFVIPAFGAKAGAAGLAGGISDKPWFVVATKADVEGTQENYQRLRTWLTSVSSGTEKLGAGGDAAEGREKRWKGEIGLFPVCALRGEGVGRIVAWTRGLLEL